MIKSIIPIFLFFLLACNNNTRPGTDTTNNSVEPARDSAFIDSVLARYFAAVSGKGGKDWTSLRGLVYPTAQFNGMGITEQGTNIFHGQGIDEFIGHMTPYILEYGFYQQETHRLSEHYASMTHAFSTYESRNAPGGEIIDKGIISFQLMNLEGSWKIMSVMWHSQTATTPLPPAYLPH